MIQTVCLAGIALPDAGGSLCHTSCTCDLSLCCLSHDIFLWPAFLWQCLFVSLFSWILWLGYFSILHDMDVAIHMIQSCVWWKMLPFENKDSSTKKKKTLPFETQYHPALPNLKNILMGKWHLIQNQPHLKERFQEPPTLSYCTAKSLKDTLVGAKLWSYRFPNCLRMAEVA